MNRSWQPPQTAPTRTQRRIGKRAVLAALRAGKDGQPDAHTPTTDAVRATINQTIQGTVQALRQGLPGVDFLVVGLRHGGSGQADVFFKTSMPKEASLTLAEVLEGVAGHFRAQAGTPAPGTDSGGE